MISKDCAGVYDAPVENWLQAGVAPVTINVEQDLPGPSGATKLRA